MIKYIITWVVFTQVNYQWKPSYVDRLEFYNRDSAVKMVHDIKFNTHEFGLPDINLKLDSIKICE